MHALHASPPRLEAAAGCGPAAGLQHLGDGAMAPRPGGAAVRGGRTAPPNGDERRGPRGRGAAGCSG